MRLPHRLVVSACLAFGASVAVAPSSVAAQVESDHYTFSETHIEQEEHEDFCPNVEFDVLWSIEAEGFFHGVRHGDGLIYFADHFRSTEVNTNVENGKTLTIVTAATDKDQMVVDNGDGTLSVTIKFVGRTSYYGPEGEKLAVDAGQFRGVLLIDHGGTPGDPSDDEFLEFLGEEKFVGHHPTADRDFCEDLVTFLG